MIFSPPRRNWAKFHLDVAGESGESSDGTYQSLTGSEQMVEYDTRLTVPDVQMRLVDEPNKVKLGIEFDWTEEITSFDTMSIETTAITNFSEITGAGKFWRADITLPSNAQGTATITVKKNSVDGVETEGPQEDAILTFDYDTRNRNINAPAQTRQCSHQFNFADNPYIDNGGAFDGVFESLYHDGWLYVVVQLQHSYQCTEDTAALTNFVQAGAVLLRCRLSDCMWQTVKKYENITTAARSLCIHDGRVTWFEGSNYSAFNEGCTIEIENIDSVIAYGNIGLRDDRGAREQNLLRFRRVDGGTIPGEYRIVNRHMLLNIDNKAPISAE